MGVHPRSEVSIPVVGTLLEGDLTVPDGAVGIVAFAHGSGSSRHSSRNQRVAEALNRDRIATLLFDLFDASEKQRDRELVTLRFDVALLAGRTVGVLDWLAQQPATAELKAGCFGASTGAAAALIAAASRPSHVTAVVSRGGRPDLAGEALGSVSAPTLLIVGGNDRGVLELNEQARGQLRCETVLEVVPGAGHLFAERGALERVELLARTWFRRWLGRAEPR
jgi:putative phosphoribosyl transferase